MGRERSISDEPLDHRAGRFRCRGPATRIDQGGAGETEVYLVPPRSILRSVSDVAALVLVDHHGRTAEIIEVIDGYVEASEQDWLDLKARAERALENRGKSR